MWKIKVYQAKMQSVLVKQLMEEDDKVLFKSALFYDHF